MVKRNTKIAHATRKGHVPNAKDEGIQPRPRAMVQKDKSTPGLFGKAGGFHKPKEPIKAGKVVKKDRKGVAKSPKAKG
jgi:hypothetical protein